MDRLLLLFLLLLLLLSLSRWCSFKWVSDCSRSAAVKLQSEHCTPRDDDVLSESVSLLRFFDAPAIAAAVMFAGCGKERNARR